AIGTLHRLCRALLGPRWKAQAVSFTHAAPQSLQVHSRVFRCPVEFGAELNGIVCAASDLERRNPLADAAMAAHAERLVASMPAPGGSSIADGVRQELYILLPMGQATIEQVASGRGMNVRTLQRRLDEAGETFSRILSAV